MRNITCGYKQILIMFKLNVCDCVKIVSYFPPLPLQKQHYMTKPKKNQNNNKLLTLKKNQNNTVNLCGHIWYWPVVSCTTEIGIIIARQTPETEKCKWTIFWALYWISKSFNLNFWIPLCFPSIVLTLNLSFFPKLWHVYEK